MDAEKLSKRDTLKRKERGRDARMRERARKGRERRNKGGNARGRRYTKQETERKKKRWSERKGGGGRKLGVMEEPVCGSVLRISERGASASRRADDATG